MKLRISSLLALILLSLGLEVLVSPALPAWACSCVSAEGQDARADLIVTGTVAEVSDNAIQLTVESVEKGTVAAGTVQLQVGRDEVSCGYGFRTGERYRVHSIGGETGLCAGVKRLSARSTTAPPAATSSPAAATSRPAVAEPARPASGGSVGGWLLAGGMTAAAFAATVVIVARRRRRAD